MQSAVWSQKLHMQCRRSHALEQPHASCPCIVPAVAQGSSLGLVLPLAAVWSALQTLCAPAASLGLQVVPWQGSAVINRLHSIAT